MGDWATDGNALEQRLGDTSTTVVKKRPSSSSAESIAAPNAKKPKLTADSEYVDRIFCFPHLTPMNWSTTANY